MSSMLDDLLDPLALPDPTEKVGLVQTHISAVLITDNFAYKIKKPVDFGFLDFTTLEKRRYYCHREVELNRRLSEGLYLGVLPVVADRGKHKLGKAEGRVVDYAVKMRRLPEESLMKNLFEAGTLRQEHLKKVAEVLARFHAGAERSAAIDRFGAADAFKINTDENFAQVEKYVGITIKPEHYRTIKRWTEEYYQSNTAFFAARIDEGRIRDCHGDLHMEHICLDRNTVSVFDCIEFNDRFRYGDTLADIAFLLMDLEFHNGGSQAEKLWKLYQGRAGEGDVADLLQFYKIYRAFVRGKVNSFQIDDPGISTAAGEKSKMIAKRYFELARSYLD